MSWMPLGSEGEIVVGVRVRVKADVPIEKRSWKTFTIPPLTKGTVVEAGKKVAFVVWDDHPKPTEVFPKMRNSYFNSYMDGWQIDLNYLELL